LTRATSAVTRSVFGAVAIRAAASSVMVAVLALIPWSVIAVGGLVAEVRAEDPAALSSERHLVVNDVTRAYFLHEPPSANGHERPLVMVFHGGQGDGTRIARQTGFNRVADKGGFVVVYPNSLGYWNDGRSTTASSPDDLAFVRGLIDHLVKTEKVDRHRVYATGASNGGMFTLRLACEMSSEIAAFAPVIASFPVDYRGKCRPERPVPVLMVNGTSDAFIPWQGGAIKKGLFRGAGGEVVPVPETLEFWRRHNRCSPEPTVRPLPDLDKNDGTTVQVITYANCQGTSALRFIRIDGGGHTWPGSEYPPSGVAARLMGNTSRDINASEAIWDFFKDWISGG
jgi:polyhydroxybutyrate depolymerase